RCQRADRAEGPVGLRATLCAAWPGTSLITPGRSRTVPPDLFGLEQNSEEKREKRGAIGEPAAKEKKDGTKQEWICKERCAGYLGHPFRKSGVWACMFLSFAQQYKGKHLSQRDVQNSPADAQ